jgi:hypothetical protein
VNCKIIRPSIKVPPAADGGALEAVGGLTLRSSRLAAVRWPGAAAPRASQTQASAWPAREGRERLSERTLAAPASPHSNAIILASATRAGIRPRQREHSTQIATPFGTAACEILSASGSASTVGSLNRLYRLVLRSISRTPSGSYCSFGAEFATLCPMTMHVNLPDELVEQIDHVAPDRSAFVAEAVRRLLRESTEPSRDEIERINEFSEELNREAAEVLEYQVIS